MAYAKINSVTNANMAKVSSAAKAALGKIGSIDAPSSDDAFTFTVDTTDSSGSASDTFVLPLVNNGSINFTVDWGDSSTDTITAYNQAEITHVYGASGTYTIKMEGTIRGWDFSGAGDRRKMRVISNWGDFNFTDDQAFNDCRSMTVTASDAPTITTDSFYQMFTYCYALSDLGTGISSWDITTVESFYRCFKYITAFNGDVSSWDVSNTTNLGGMFDRCDAFNQDLSGWDVSGVSQFRDMFKSTDSAASSFDQNLSSWDMSTANSMSNFMYGQTLSTANYDALLIGWAAQTLNSGVSVHFGSSTYTSGGAAETARTSLINDDSWTITDGGAA